MVIKTTLGADFTDVCAVAWATLKAVRRKKIRRKESGIESPDYLTKARRTAATAAERL
jgi:hypothetical protein